MTRTLMTSVIIFYAKFIFFAWRKIIVAAPQRPACSKHADNSVDSCPAVYSLVWFCHRQLCGIAS